MKMKRKLYQQMLQWKERSQGQTALLIEGARRTGKSYIVEQFAKAEYRSYLLIDFAVAPEQVKSLFNDYLYDLDAFFLFLRSFYPTPLYRRKSVIIFDEVQRFPRAREAIKYLVKDGRYDYIETGSLLSIKKNVKDINIPSEERHLKLYPMDFEEFLWAKGNDALLPLLEKQFASRLPLGPQMHRIAMDLFRQYLIVGGMPQAVDCFIQTQDFEQVDLVKQDILDLYRQDIVKHADADVSKVNRIIDDLPSQLGKHEKVFRLTSLSKGARYRDFETAFYWLDDAGIVNTAYNSSEPTVGLSLSKDNASFKCYLADTGLLLTLAFNEPVEKSALYRKILFDKLNFNQGMILENAVAQMLRAKGHSLYFYSRSGQEADKRMEIDFLTVKRSITSQHNVCPIEVKSSNRYTLNSLKKFKTKFSDQIDTPYLLHPGDVEIKDDIIYLPYYMAPLL